MVNGLYFYDAQVVDVGANLNPSSRSKLGITNISREDLECNKFHVEIMGHRYAWLDTGTTNSVLDTADFVRVFEKRQGVKIASPEEIAYCQSFIDGPRLEQAIGKLGKPDYDRDLLGILLTGKL